MVASIMCLSAGAQKVALKTNLLYDATTTMNLGVEFGTSVHTSIDVSANYNPWTFSDNRKMKQLLVQPEFRYWFCERFNGSFVALHAHYGIFNFGGMLPWGFNSGKMFGTIENPTILSHRYQGWLAGAGLTYGRHVILSPRWGLEYKIGVGYAYLDYDIYPCKQCGKKTGSENKHYIGPTEAAISLVYMIK